MTPVITFDHLEFRQDKHFENPICIKISKEENKSVATIGTQETLSDGELLSFDEEEQDAIQYIIGIPFKSFNRKTASTKNSFNPVYTLNKLIDLTFCRISSD